MRGKLQLKWSFQRVLFVGIYKAGKSQSPSALKAILHFRHRQKSSQIYKYLTGFTEGNGERLLLKYYPMKCFTSRENIKTIINSRCRDNGFILNTCHDTAKRAETRVGFSRYFLPTPMAD